jgi:hypothetical protein
MSPNDLNLKIKQELIETTDLVKQALDLNSKLGGYGIGISLNGLLENYFANVEDLSKQITAYKKEPTFLEEIVREDNVDFDKIGLSLDRVKMLSGIESSSSSTITEEGRKRLQKIAGIKYPLKEVTSEEKKFSSEMVTSILKQTKQELEEDQTFELLVQANAFIDEGNERMSPMLTAAARDIPYNSENRETE